MIFIILVVFSYARMMSQVNNSLDSLVNSSGEISYGNNDGVLQPGSANLDKGMSRNCLVINVDVQEDKYICNPKYFYSPIEMDAIIKNANKDKAILYVNGYRLAYRKVDILETGDIYTLYIYDYSVSYESFKVSTIVSVVSLIILVCVIAFFIIDFNKKTLNPIGETIEKQKELIQNASHELKTPLTIINTNIEIIKQSDDNLTEEQKQFFNSIYLQSQRMNSLVQEMLELAKFDNNKNTVIETIDFSSIVESISLETEVLAFDKKIKFDYKINEDVKISANTTDIEHLIYTLVENAIKYTPENGEINITLEKNKPKNKMACLKIRNTGVGISKEKLPKVFDRFYRADEAHTDGKSFGLGLAIAKSITERYKGTISVESKENEYTLFTVIFKEV
ncbi:MAG: HAMP domain-containing histidine kinase [Clostridia bacterium]|nr:HAMP domain-containing histidine kinase [Clostridia bacterium]